MKGEVTTVEGNTGEKTEKLKQLDVAAIENPELVNTVEERLANLSKLTKEPPKRSAESDDDDHDDTTPDDQDDQTAGDQDQDPDPTPTDKDGDKDADKDVLPPAYLRAAIHRGWKEEDAEEFFEKNPEAALKTFQNCYLDVNNASREWALLGKAKQERDKKPDTPMVNAEPEFKGIDIDKLREDSDLSDNAIAIIKAQNEQLEAVMKQRQLEPMQQVAQQTPAVSDPNVEIVVDNFFNSANLSDYSEFYGELKLGQDWSDLSSGQRNNRWRVLEQANFIVLGAESAGHKIDDLDALERAHMIISEPIREQVIRTSIKDTATKRKKGMTLRPSDGSRSQAKVASDTGGERKPATRQELTERVGEKLQSIFNR